MDVVAVVDLLTAWAKVFVRPVQPSNRIVWKTLQFGVMPPETTGQQLWPIANAGRVPLQVYCVWSGIGTTIRGIINGRDDLGNGSALVIPPGGKADIIIRVADTSSSRDTGIWGSSKSPRRGSSPNHCHRLEVRDGRPPVHARIRSLRNGGGCSVLRLLLSARAVEPRPRSFRFRPDSCCPLTSVRDGRT